MTIIIIIRRVPVATSTAEFKMMHYSKIISVIPAQNLQGLQTHSEETIRQFYLTPVVQRRGLYR